MNCLICGHKVINDNNQLQKKVVNFLKINRNILDIKHTWIKQWELCYGCSEKYSNEELEEVNHYVRSNKLMDESQNEIIRKLVSSIRKRDDSKKKQIKNKCIQVYKNKKTHEIMYGLDSGGYRRKILKHNRYDASYTSYVENGESAAVMLIRDRVDGIETKGKWLDIVTLDTYEKYRILGFNYVVIELFDRKEKPKYPPKKPNESESDYMNRMAYVTWCVANRDITNQRNKGIRGPIYLVLTHLFNVNRGKKINKIIYWDGENEKIFENGKQGEPIQIELPETPLWDYDIRHVIQITDNDINHINKHSNRILNKILENKKTEVSWFLADERKQPSKGR